MCIAGGNSGKFQYESPLRIHGRGKRTKKEEKNAETIPPIKNALLFKTEPDIETTAVDSLDRWCQ